MEILIDNQKLTLAELTVPITYAVNNGDDIITGTSTKTFKIPATAANQAIFDYVEDVKSTGITPNNKPTAVVYDGGVELMRGFAQMKSIKINGSTEYQVSIISDNRDWANAFKQISLRDEDWSDGTHELSWTNQTNSETFTLTNTSGDTVDWIVYPLINYGSLRFDYSTVLSISDRYPSFKISEILYRIFKTQGYKISSTFYTNVLTNLYIPLTEDFRKPESFREEQLFRATKSLNQNLNIAGGNETIIFQTENFDNGNNYSDPTFTVAEKALYNFTTIIKINSTSGSNQNITVRIYKNGTDILATRSFVLAPGDNATASIDLLNYGTTGNENGATLDVGDLVTVKVEYQAGIVVVEQNSTFENDVILDYIEGQDVEVERLIPNITQLEFLQAIKDVFNLKFWTDTKERIVYFEPEEDFYNGSEVDISDKIDYNKTIEETFFNTARELDFTYSNDSNDKFLTEYNNHLDSSLGSRQVTSSNKFGAATKTYSAKFSPTYMGNMEQLGLFQTQVPRLWSEESLPAKTTKFNIRILYYNGVVSTEANEIYSYVEVVGGTVFTRSDYPKMSFYDLDNANLNSLRFDDLDGNIGLVSKYHKYRINRLNNSRILTLNLNLTADFINSFDFRDTYKIDSGSKPEISGFYHLVEISDYTRGSTKVTLMQIPISDPIINTSVGSGGHLLVPNERKTTDGFWSTADGTKLLSKGERIAEYSESYGFLGDGFPMTIEIGADEPITYEMYIEVNGQEVKITI